MKKIVLLLLLLFCSRSFAGHTLHKLTPAHQQKTETGAKVTIEPSGVILSGQPQVRTKFCPSPEGTTSTAAGGHNCYPGATSYNLILDGRAKGYAFSRVRNEATYIYSYWHLYGGSNKAIQNNRGAYSSAHIGHYVIGQYKITGTRQNYKVKINLRCNLFQPTGVSALGPNDMFKSYQKLYVDGYNYVDIKWDQTAKKWKATGYHQKTMGASPTQIDEYVTDNFNSYAAKTWVCEVQVSNDSPFTHQALYNWAGGNNGWATQYGIELENIGANAPDKNVKFRGHGWVEIIQTSDL